MPDQGGHHEFSILAAGEVVRGSSDRSFGWVFAGVFALLAAHNFWQGHHYWPFELTIAIVFAVVTLVRPALLAPLNRLWTKFGLLLGKIIAPLVLGALYYLVFTPIGLLMRMSGKDPLRLKPDPNASSYWIVREPAGPAPESMRNQF